VSFDVVVAADLEWGIGKASGLPWPKLKGDLAHFKRVTCSGASNAVVMGRKTWQSKEVAGRALPNRLNVVVTRGELVVPDGVVVAHALDTALEAARACAAIFVVGGGELFRDAFAREDLRWVYLTRVEGRYGCDAHIPDLDAAGFVHDAWDGEQVLEESGVRYRIERLVRA
jgi:dihydrofolate reductase